MEKFAGFFKHSTRLLPDIRLNVGKMNLLADPFHRLYPPALRIQTHLKAAFSGGFFQADPGTPGVSVCIVRS
jgi:hypothetical protein